MKLLFIIFLLFFIKLKQKKMKKSNKSFKKQSTKKKKFFNPLNCSQKINTTSYNINNSSLSSITSPSILSRKTIDPNRVLSPLDVYSKNKKKKNLKSYNFKTQRVSPNSRNRKNINYDKNQEIKNSLLGYNTNGDNSEKTPKNISNKKDNDYDINSENSIKLDNAPVGKHALNEKIKNCEAKEKEKEKEKEIKGLKELDNDLMKTYNSNDKDLILNKDISIHDIMKDKSNEFNYFKIDDGEGLTNLEKQGKLIKKLLRTKNYQNFVNKLLKDEPILVNPDGEVIEFNLFNKDLYNYEFLDIYYKHNIPFIIMRPRLDVIRRKREAKLKSRNIDQDKDESKDEKILYKNSQDTSQLTSLMDKSISELESNSKSNTMRFDGTYVLTKIPQKTEENTKNRRLNIAFNKATDAARMVRRLEYSYGMRINILLSKPLYQKNAKVIQKWWKDVVFVKKNKDKILKIQAYIRGAMIRKAFQETKHTYLYKIPFLREIDKIISRRKLKIYFDKMVAKHGILKLLNKTKPFSDKINNTLESFKNRRKFLKENHMLYFPKKNKCCYTKEIFDWEAKLKLYKAQAAVKFFLMHHNEKIIKEKYTNKYNPKLFYLLKYAKNKDKLKKKLKHFRQTFLKFKELKIKTTLPGKIDNRFLFFKYVLRRKIFNNLLNYYLDSLNNKEKEYQQKMKMKTLLNRLNLKRNKDLLRKYFTKWNIKSNFLKEFYKLIRLDKLYIIEAIFRYQKKYREKVFMLLLQSNQNEKKNKLNEAAQKAFDLYNRNNGFEYENNLLRRILQLWKKKAYQQKIDDAAKIINSKARDFLDRKRQKKLDSLLKCFNIRNKIFKEKLKLWKFNSRKIIHHFNAFKNKTLSIVKTREKLDCLKKNFKSLQKRQKEKLRKYFNRFKKNTGVRKLVYINVQLCFFNENKEIISRDKYSMLKFVRNNNNVDIEKIKKDIVLKKNFDFWKIEKKATGLKRLCGKRISDLCTRAFYLEKLKFLHWHQIVEQLKYDKASRLIQKNYHIYMKNKLNKKNNNNINNNINNINNNINNINSNNIIIDKNSNNSINNISNNFDINSNKEQNGDKSEESEQIPKKRKRWKRYDRTIKSEDDK